MLHYLPGSEHKIVHANKVSGRGCKISLVRQTRLYMPTRYKDGTAGSHGFGTIDPTCIRGNRTGLQDLTGKEHRVEHAYKVSGRGCRISWVGNYRSYMPTMYQEWNTDRRAYQDGAARSHGYGTSDRTTDPSCIQGIRMRLQDLTGSEQQIQHAYKV